MYTLDLSNEQNHVDDSVEEMTKLVESESNYKIIRLIAKGGMSYVFLAKDLKCQRHVALKMMQSSQSKLRINEKRFIEEVQVTSQLDHPSIVPIYDLNKSSDGMPFYAMKLVKGETLEEILRQLESNNSTYVAQYPIHVLMQIFTKICDAMIYAASKYVVHRDLKPENIMIGQYGEVYVMDWGIAKVCTPLETKQLLRKQSIYDFEDSFVKTLSQMSESISLSSSNDSYLGTPVYMAPEQVCQDFDVDTRADIYALGAILYRILYLKHPFRQKSMPELFKAKINNRVSWPDQFSKSLPHINKNKIPYSLIMVAKKAMAVELNKRYQKVGDLKQEVDSWLHGFATDVEAANPVTRARLFFVRQKTLSVVSCLLVVSLAALGYQFFLKYYNTSLDKNSLSLDLKQTSIKNKKNILVKLRLERELNEYKNHISSRKERLNDMVIDEKSIRSAIKLSEQLTVLEPSVDNYRTLINLYIKNKDYTLANESLIYALAIYPSESRLHALVDDIQ